MAPDDAETTGLVSEDRYGVYQADSRQLADTLSNHFDKSELEGLVDATVTSPPYADIKDYGYDEQIGKGDSYDQYLDDLRAVFKEVYEVTADDGSLWLNINNRQFGGRIVDIKAHIIETLENLENVQHCERCGDRVRRNGETGELYCTNVEEHDNGEEWRHDPTEESWSCHNEIIWDKQKSNDERAGVRNVFEYVLVFKKTDEFSVNEDARIYDPKQLKQWWISDTYNYSPDGATYPNVWDIPAEITGGWGDDDLDHDAVFPAALVERMIEMATEPGDTVLDPFAGSGTTPAVGKLMDRQSIGFELNTEYIDLHDSRYESIKRNWSEQEHLSLEERKERYAQATWALRHHGYVKWLFTTLRSQARDVADGHDLWQALAEAAVTDALCDQSPDETLVDGIAGAVDADAPLTEFIETVGATETQIRETLAAEADEDDSVSDKDVAERRETTRRTLVETGIDTVEHAPEELLAALLEEFAHRETVDVDRLLRDLRRAPDESSSGGNAETEVESYESAAQELLEQDDAAEVFERLTDVISVDAVTKTVERRCGATQATLGSWGTQAEDGPPRTAVLAGALLVGIAHTTSLEGLTSVAAIEPLVTLQRTFGDRFGIHSVVLQPAEADGTPTEGEDRAKVTQSFLFESSSVADTAGPALETAAEYLLTETPSSNAKKLRKHGLDTEMEWCAASDFAEKIDEDALRYDPDSFYLYANGRHYRYTTAFDTEGRLWDTCTSQVKDWVEKYCTRTAPAIVSPLALAIEEAAPEQPQYTIEQINTYGNAAPETANTENQTLF